VKKILLLDPLGYGKFLGKHFHPLRDWTGAYIIGDIAMLPMELMYAAAYLRREGHLVGIVEANAHHWGHSEVCKEVLREDPDFILIPATYFSLEGDKRLAVMLKQVLPGAKIIFSGPPVTYDPAPLLEEGIADYAVSGELELPVSGILSCGNGNGVARSQGGKITRTPRQVLSLEHLPAAARDLVDGNAYRYAFFNRHNPVTAMVISRGCAHGRCGFCPSALYNDAGIRYRGLDGIKEEISEIVYKYGFREMFFRDQTFTANRELTSAVCDFILSSGINISWRATTRVDMVDKELLALMRRAGCYQLSFGFESCSQRSLDMAGKGITLEQSRLAAQWAKEAGLEVVGFFMLGMQGDTEENMSALSGFALQLKVDYALFDMTYALPGTPYYETMKKTPEKFPQTATARKYAAAAFWKFNGRPEYILRQLRKIRSFSDVKFLAMAGLNALKAYICSSA